MVTVRPCVRVLKQLYEAGSLPPAVAAAYKAAKGTDDHEQKVRYLEEAVRIAGEQLDLVTVVQKQFEHNRFEQHKTLSSLAGTPVFEAREKRRKDSPAWRGAIVQHSETGCAWLVHAGIHDHFHAEARTVIVAMRNTGKLGPSSIDLKILELAQRIDASRETQRAFLMSLLGGIQESVATGEKVAFGLKGDSPQEWLNVTVSVSTDSFREWEIESAHTDLDMVCVEIERGPDWDFFEAFLGTCVTYVQPDEDLVEQLNSFPFIMNMAVSRARLASLMDVAGEELPTGYRASARTEQLHYANKTSLTESLVLGKALQAVCGRWWVPVGDEVTHGNLPICEDCEREMSVAQVLDNWVRG